MRNLPPCFTLTKLVMFMRSTEPELVFHQKIKHVQKLVTFTWIIWEKKWILRVVLLHYTLNLYLSKTIFLSIYLLHLPLVTSLNGFNTTQIHTYSLCYSETSCLYTSFLALVLFFLLSSLLWYLEVNCSYSNTVEVLTVNTLHLCNLSSRCWLVTSCYENVGFGEECTICLY